MRGDVRVAVLLLLSEEIMHGYQLMQTIAERTAGAWKPSPGAIYPVLSQLEDEGLAVVVEDGGRKLAMLTEAGQNEVEAKRDQWPDPFNTGEPDGGPNLRELMGQLADATRQVGRAGTTQQREAAATVLTDARRAMYLLLADASDADEEEA